MTNAFPYILIICIFCVLAYFCEQTQKIELKEKYKYISVGIFIFFFGLRGFILSDWIVYYEYFFNCDFSYLLGWPTTQGVMEPGFTLLCLLVKTIMPNYSFFVFITTAINTYLLLLFFKGRISNLPLALAIYICFEGLLISTNFMRNSIAILLFLNSLNSLETRDAKKYFLLIFIAFCFHSSALLYMPLYFVFNRKCNKWIYLGIFMICNVIFLSKVSLFSSLLSIFGIDEDISMKVRAYTELYDKSSKISIGYLERLLTGCLIFCFFDKLNDIRKENAVFINAVLAYFICFFCISEFEVLSKRLCALFAFGYWILWIDLLKCFSIKNNKNLYALFIGLYCILKIGSSTMLPDFKYENIIFGASSYQERLYYHNRTYDGP